MPQQILEADEADGQKILGHIFGDSEKQTVNEIASKSKVDPSVVLKVLAILAPVLLSSLQSVTAATANAQQAKKPGVDLSDGLDVSDLVAIFQGTQQSGVSGLLGALLGGKVDTSTPQAATDGTALLGSLLSLMGK